MSALLSQALAVGRVVVRKNRKVSGEVAIHFMDPGLEPVRLVGYNDIILTDIAGVDVTAIQRSNIRKLQTMGLIEVSY